MTRYHSLTSAELDVIASGNPDAVVIETLLSGQYSKRVVMINAILAAAADRYPEVHIRLEAAYALLAAAQQADPPAVRTILTHPSVGRWTRHCLRSLQSDPDALAIATDLGQLAAIAAAAAIRARRTFTIEVPLRDHKLLLPSLGLADLGPEAPLAATESLILALVRHDADWGSTTIMAGGKAVQLPADPAHDSPERPLRRRVHRRRTG
jgi:HEXXH motif-containing protein